MNHPGLVPYAYEAKDVQENLYRQVLQEAASKNRRLPNVLDFGSGKRGTGRVLMDPILSREGGGLDLYEPFDTVSPSFNKDTKQVDDDAVFGPRRKEYDIVNISYVLCTMPPDEAGALLIRLREAQPQASYIIVDYILKNRTRDEVTSVLQTDSEKQWMARSGVDAFLATRGQHDVATFAELLKKHNMPEVAQAKLMDTYPTRAAFVLQEDADLQPFMLSENPIRITARILRRMSAVYSYAIGKCMNRVKDAEKLTDITTVTNAMRDSIDILSAGFGNDRLEKISADTLRIRGFTDLAIDLERRVQNEVSPSRKTLLPLLKAKWDIANIQNARLQYQTY